MTQYPLKKEDDFKNLGYALANYQVLRFNVSPFSLSNETTCLTKHLNEEILTFTKNKELRFFIDNNEIIKFPLEDYATGFKLEYRNENQKRIFPMTAFPNRLSEEPKRSVFRNVIDNLLIEIDFEGKILIEPYELDERNIPLYWKLCFLNI